ncbi:MAG: hypothetical protein Q7J42_19030 [Sulfuritalea sp.]|nr:hypothetical protein [Sulfuritalea sp.]
MGKIERRLFLHSLSAGVAGGLTGLISQALAADAQAIGQGIRRVHGEVSVNGKPAREGTPIRRGDTISTGQNSDAIYVLGDNAFYQRAGSRVDFGKSSAATFLRVLTGGLLSVFGKGSRQIATSATTIGIRGTGCYIEAEERRSYFCLCYGTAVLQPKNGQTVRYTTKHHERPLWIENGATSPASVVNHTDAEIIMLEEFAGRSSPFPAGGGSYS